MTDELETIYSLQRDLRRLQLTVALFTGHRAGDERALKDWFNRSSLNKPMVCDECGRFIQFGGHKKRCPILVDYEREVGRIEHRWWDESKYEH